MARYSKPHIKTSKGFEQQTPLKIKGNLIDSKAKSQQAPVHWLREITKAKLCQAKTFFNHIFLLKQ